MTARLDPITPSSRTPNHMNLPIYTTHAQDRADGTSVMTQCYMLDALITAYLKMTDKINATVDLLILNTSGELAMLEQLEISRYKVSTHYPLLLTSKHIWGHLFVDSKDYAALCIYCTVYRGAESCTSIALLDLFCIVQWSLRTLSSHD